MQSPARPTPAPILADPVYVRLLSAQVIALLGTGLLTVALGLLAYDLAGGNAGVVLGTALTIKMLAYVGVSPVMSALTAHLPRKHVLITADLLRAVTAIALPFVTQTWQIYLLIFVLQAASATFTPAFQAVLPEVLTDERQYTRALSLSRLAYDLESLLSPLLAAALLTLMTYGNLFAGTALGFAASALLVLGARLPGPSPTPATPFRQRLTSGVQIFRHTPELRGLAAMNLTVATSTAMVVVNTVVLVQSVLGRPQSDVAWLLAAYGAGSMIVALALPKILETGSDRTITLAGTAILPLGLVLAAGVIHLNSWTAILIVWLVLGGGTSLILTPSARLIRRACATDLRPAVFSAQFSLSHLCFMLTYPIAGLLGSAIGLPRAALVLAALGAVGLAAALSSYASER